ncbi:MAG TPA: transglutaminase family protein [Puia sp.]|nr:transglutaminase family protein [Puia sp.]
MPRFTIHHVTKYNYDAPVRDSANQIVLFPIRDEYQNVLKQELVITGDPELDIFKDYYGNEVGSFMNAEPHYELLIDSKVQVETKFKDLPQDLEPKEKQWALLQTIRFQLPYIDFLDLEQNMSLQEVRSVSNIETFKDITPLEAAKRLTDYVFNNFQYIKGITDVETTFDEAWKLKAGVCQDFAHILLVMLRMASIPARYVSGYICPNKKGMRGEGATHAWVEVYIPSYGWLGLDPTNNCYVNDLHVRLAVGRNFSDCSPVRGTYKGISDHSLEVGVSVSYEDGRITEETSAVLTPQPGKKDGQQNSYQRFLEMQQQQQQ